MKDDTTVYLETVSRLEPEIHPIDAAAAYASVSISLKRIADALDENLRIIADKLDAIEMSVRAKG